MTVVKMGGAVCLDPAQVAAIAADIRFLLDAGRRVTVVHGGGPQLDAALAALGEPVRKLDGLRVTSPAAAAVVREVMDRIGAALAAQLARHGIPATHVPAGPLRATLKRSPAGDLGRVGAVASFDAASLPMGVAVVTPVGFDGEGPLNVNADEGAAAVAAALKAHWLVLATDVTAVRDASGQSLERLTPNQARALVESGAATGGMLPKLEAATAALRGGTRHVLVTRLRPGLLADAVLRRRPEGTLFEPDPIEAP